MTRRSPIALCLVYQNFLPVFCKSLDGSAEFVYNKSGCEHLLDDFLTPKQIRRSGVINREPRVRSNFTNAKQSMIHSRAVFLCFCDILHDFPENP